jgi:hypothetical protein
MSRAARIIWLPLVGLAVMAWLADLPASVGVGTPGIAHAKGEGGGGNGGGSGGGNSGKGSGGKDGSDGPGNSGNGRGGDAADSGSGRAGRGADPGESGRGHGHAGRSVGNAVSEAATTTAHAGKAAAQAAGYSNLGEAVSAAVHEAQEQSGAPEGTTTTSVSRSTKAGKPAPGDAPKNQGQAVSAAAHTAKSEAKAAGSKVGPAVSAAVHRAQQEAREREAAAEDQDTAALSGGSTTGTTQGRAGRTKK